MTEEKRLDVRSRRAYVEGLKRIQQKGIPVLIVGREADDSLWEKLFEIREDGGFYMGDYVLEEVKPEKPAEVLRESKASYGSRKYLKEIRFEIVYHR